MCPRGGGLYVPLIPLSQGHSVMGESQGMKGYEGICLLACPVHQNLPDQSKAFCSELLQENQPHQTVWEPRVCSPLPEITPNKSVPQPSPCRLRRPPGSHDLLPSETHPDTHRQAFSSQLWGPHYQSLAQERPGSLWP